MRKIILSLIVLCSLGFSGGSAPDPFVLSFGKGEPDNTVPSNPGFANANGRTIKSSILADPTHTAIILVPGQSLAENAVAGTYSTVNATALNFSIYDGGLWGCKQPVLGTPWAQALSPNGNNINCQIADSLITAGTYTNVIMVPIAIGGSTCANWDTGGPLNPRITVAINRLKSRGFTTATGFTGDFWILWHQGESELPATPAATIATCIKSIASQFAAAGTGSARFFVPQSESFVSGATQANVISAQSLALSGCTTCRAGANWDSLTGASRQDGTHWNAAGAISAVALDVAIITNCKNTAC